ncbi:MAG: Ldh family oxidoreductase [Terriglobia bacterium]
MDNAKGLYNPTDLSAFARALFERAGLTEKDAEVVADGLVKANLRGLDSHGVARIPVYLARLRGGGVKPQPAIAVTRVAQAAKLVDGDSGMGFVVGRRAMEEAIAIASESGVGLVGVRRSTHFGMAALYALQAIEAGYISLVFTNSSPAIPAWGGRTTFLGASPMAAGMPGGSHAPYVLDMAMTVIARGKIRLAAMHGEPIPEGLALDSEGKPTTDAKKAFEGVLLPFGGVKGAALSMLMDLLAGVFTGADYGGEVAPLYSTSLEAQNVGHLFIAVQPSLFMAREAFDQRMDTFAGRVKNLPRAAGFAEILMPGEPEVRTEKMRRATGIPISGEVADELRAEARREGIPFPEASSVPLHSPGV